MSHCASTCVARRLTSDSPHVTSDSVSATPRVLSSLSFLSSPLYVAGACTRKQHINKDISKYIHRLENVSGEYYYINGNALVICVTRPSHCTNDPVIIRL